MSCIEIEQILNGYYEDNAKKLHRMVDRILSGFGGVSDKDVDDFYSLANEVFTDIMSRYDRSKSFDVLLYSCLSNRIKTEMTRRNREKRRLDRVSIPIDTPVDGEEDITIGDMIADDFLIERELIEKSEAGYSRRVLRYLDRLSKLQQEILRLDTAGYLPDEIREVLHIDEKQYADCYDAIRSYRNVAVLLG